MACRYRVARARGQAHYEAIVETDRELLGAFGAGLLSAGGGVRVFMKAGIRNGRVNPWDVIEVGPKVWDFIRPILIEVKELRAWKKERLRSIPRGGSAAVLPLRQPDHASVAAAAK